MVENKEHYKMYKDGKNWVTAKITTASVCVGVLSMLVSGGIINADTVSNMSSTPTTQSLTEVNTNANTAIKASSLQSINTQASSLKPVNSGSISKQQQTPASNVNTQSKSIDERTYKSSMQKSVINTNTVSGSASTTSSNVEQASPKTVELAATNTNSVSSDSTASSSSSSIPTLWGVKMDPNNSSAITYTAPFNKPTQAPVGNAIKESVDGVNDIYLYDTVNHKWIDTPKAIKFATPVTYDEYNSNDGDNSAWNYYDRTLAVFQGLKQYYDNGHLPAGYEINTACGIDGFNNETTDTDYQHTPLNPVTEPHAVVWKGVTVYPIYGYVKPVSSSSSEVVSSSSSKPVSSSSSEVVSSSSSKPVSSSSSKVVSSSSSKPVSSLSSKVVSSSSSKPVSSSSSKVVSSSSSKPVSSSSSKVVSSSSSKPVSSSSSKVVSSSSSKSVSSSSSKTVENSSPSKNVVMPKPIEENTIAISPQGVVQEQKPASSTSQKPVQNQTVGSGSGSGNGSGSGKGSEEGLPQTGESKNKDAVLIGLSALGIVGMMGLGLNKKRYE